MSGPHCNANPASRFPEREHAVMPGGSAPALLVVLDCEEEFDWHGPFARGNTGIGSMAALAPFQALCDARELRPTYVVTYPIVTQSVGRETLATLLSDGRAQVGAHQHPWVCPPFDETVNAFHSYPGNLPLNLERQKLDTLTQAIESSLGFRPTIYKAGRYGFGPHTARILADLGYEIDLSPCSAFDHSSDGGPDDSSVPATPFGFGDGLYCFPTTGGFVGRLPEGLGRITFGIAARPWLAWSRATGVLSRLRLVERIRLSPEGFSLDEMIRLTRHLILRGERVVTMTLHTPSLEPGHTPYVRSSRDLDRFLGVIRDYFSFFFDELGGRASTPHELRDFILQPQPSPRA